MTTKKNEAWKHDADYIRYVASGESAAVFVVRDIVEAANTKGKWIDIISLDSYTVEPDGRAFNWIVCEIFPRKIQPQYVDDPDENKYITWKTAYRDILQQRSKGYNGPKFLVLCTLRNKNKGKHITLKFTEVIRKYTDSEGNTWEFDNPADGEEKEEKFVADFKPDWEYRINFLRRLKDSQAEYIKSNEAEIHRKIIISGKVTLEILGITSQPKKEYKLS